MWSVAGRIPRRIRNVRLLQRKKQSPEQASRNNAPVLSCHFFQLQGAWEGACSRICSQCRGLPEVQRKASHCPLGDAWSEARNMDFSQMSEKYKITKSSSWYLGKKPKTVFDTHLHTMLQPCTAELLKAQHQICNPGSVASVIKLLPCNLA